MKVPDNGQLTVAGCRNGGKSIDLADEETEKKGLQRAQEEPISCRFCTNAQKLLQKYEIARQDKFLYMSSRLLLLLLF